MQIDDELPVMLVISSPKEHVPVGIEKTNAIDDYSDNEFIFISLELPVVCSVVTANPETNTTPSTLPELLDKQPNDAFFWQRAALVRTPSSCYSYERHDSLVYTAWLDGAIRTVVPDALRRSQLFTHYPKLVGHPGERQIYDTKSPKLYWSRMKNDAYKTVGDCRGCGRQRASLRENCHLKQFPGNGCLEVVTTGKLSQLPKTTTGNQFIIVVSDRYMRVTRANLS